MSKQSKFALYDFLGNPTSHWLVNEKEIATSTATVKQEIGHHIMVVDCSGSMYREITPIRETLIKLLTLEEYRDQEMLVSLISYASHGDVVVHFAKESVQAIMANSQSVGQSAIRSLRTRGLTCISQALLEANRLIDDSEITAITLHSDGYANDRSPRQEKILIEQVCEELKGKNVFVNTIAYAQWSDFKMLSMIANTVSGVCIRANNIKEVYDSMHQTNAMLTSTVSPAVLLEIGDATMQAFVSCDGAKVLGGEDDLVLRGLNPDHDGTVYRYTKVSQKDYDAHPAQDCGESDFIADLAPILAFSRVCLSLGYLNKAKYAVVATRSLTLLERNARALSNDQYVAFAQDLDHCLFGVGMSDHDFLVNDIGFGEGESSVLEVCDVLKEHASSIKIHADSLQSGYQRKSVKRVPGKIVDGHFREPTYKTKLKTGEDEEYLQLSSVDVNRTSATINLQVVQGIDLVTNNKAETPIFEVANVSLRDLKNYRKYTLVSDGSLNVDELQLNITSKKAFRALRHLGVVDGTYSHDQDYLIDFSQLPLVRYGQKFESIDGVFERIVGLKTLSSILKACAKGRSDSLSSEQIAALKEVYVTPNMYVSFPTVYDYAANGQSKDEALKNGTIDTRLSYQVQFGNKNMLNLKIPSANAMLAKFYAMTVPGEGLLKKANFQHFLTDGIKIEDDLSTRAKVTPTEAFMKPFYDNFMGLDDNDEIDVLLARCKLSTLIHGFRRFQENDWDSIDDAVEFIAEASRRIEKAIDRLYQERVNDLVFYIGATGLIPDEFEALPLALDVINIKYPHLKISKDEKEATFFEVGNSILTVYAEEKHFSCQ